MHDAISAQLSAYADGELAPGERAEVEAHLAHCGECRKVLEGITAVKGWAPRYQGMAPARDPWRNIESRLGTRPIGSGALKPAWHGRRVSVRVPLLAAAAIGLVVIGGVASRVFRPSDQVPVVQLTPVKHWNPDQERLTNDQYDAAIAELEGILASHDTALEPGTLKVIRESLATIDKAIDDARRAIAEDSTNDYLNASIAQNMRRKLGILRMAAQAATAKS